VAAEKETSPVKQGDIVAGKYCVERVLGVGGMGVVVAARHVELGELFALKFLLPNFREDPEVARRFAREARTGIRVKNEHVARVFDVGTLADGAPYMVMEHLTGRDLSNIIEARGRLPLEEAVDLLLQACEALCDAHSLGIVHRDLKPANLFVVAGSDGLPFVKVLDFGISKLITSVDDFAATASTAILGSPLYMSPEQLTSSKDVDRRADIWSLGVILYEALTGRTPFESDSFVGLTSAILGGKFEPASKRRAGIPPAVDALIASLLTVDRTARLASVEVLAPRLAPFGTASARTSSERIARIAARPPASTEIVDPTSQASATPTIDVVVDLGSGTTGAGARNSPTTLVPSRSPPPVASVPKLGVVVAGGLALTALGALGGWLALRPGPTVPSPPSSAAALSSVTPPVAAVPSTAPAPPPSSSGPVVASAAPSEAPRPPPPLASARPAAPAGASMAATLTRAFTRREADVARCFDTAADPHGTPKLSIRFTVDVDGHVKAAQISPPEVASTPLGQCLAEVARTTQFGRQTEEVSFRIPIAAR